MRKMTNPSVDIKNSWNANANQWTKAVREALIPSRAAGTDQAVAAAINQLHPESVIDVGCGEGWLVRRLARETGCIAAGADGSEQLIASAKSAHPDGTYFVLDYGELISQPEKLRGPYDVAVCNFSLLDEALVPILGALRQNLSPTATLVIQTLHPWMAGSHAGYVDGWRTEEFTGLAGNWHSMPWFFRTLETWFKDLETAGFAVKSCREPLCSDTLRPLSILFLCNPV